MFTSFVMEVEPRCKLTVADLRTWDDDGMMKLFLPISGVTAELFESLNAEDGKLIFLGLATPDMFAVKYVMYLTTIKRFADGAKEKLVEKIKGAISPGMWVSYQAAHGNQHYGTVQINSKNVVCFIFFKYIVINFV